MTAALTDRWTQRDEQILARLHGAGVCDATIAVRLNRTEVAIRSRRKVLGCVADRKWHPDQVERAKALHGKRTAEQIAAELGKSASGVYQLFFRLGLTKDRWSDRERKTLRNYIRDRYAQQWSDSEIAAGWSAKHSERTVTREWVTEVRRLQLGLPAWGNSDRRRRRVAEKTREQIRKAGLPSIGHLRREAFKAFCVRQGWPQVTRPRLAQILNLLYEQGPHTRQQIAKRIGASWKATANHPATRKGLKLGTGRSAMGVLMELGLVVRLRRTFRTGRGKGQCVFMYAIAPGVVRGPVSERSVAS
jgi:hypothetical protein